jgi:hypothetical protein
MPDCRRACVRFPAVRCVSIILINELPLVMAVVTMYIVQFYELHSPNQSFYPAFGKC